jgi:thermitase
MMKKLFSALAIVLLFLSVFGGIYVAKPVSAIGNILKEGDDSRNLESSLLNGATGSSAGQGKTKEDYSDALVTPNNALNLAYINQSNDFAYVDGNKTRLVVGIDSENPAKISELENIAGRYQARIVNEVLMRGKVRALVFELLLVSVAGFSQEVHASELATYIEPNMKVQVQYVPDDPYWSSQWGPQKIEADWAWNTTIGDSSILVAVVDTGIYYPHPDLNANYVALGRDWANNDTDPIDDYGHGTHCAGIIAAILNNSEGIAGLAQVRIMAEKVLDSSGYGYVDWVANGIIHATDCGAKIISMSIGGWGDSELVHEAVKYAYDAGVLLVAAAGNSATNVKLYPAGYDEVISVAATDENDNPAYFSNWGDWIELAAPGVNIYSTVPGGYMSESGTSMACPHVAGVAALVWSQYPNRTRDWVRMWLRYAADDLGPKGFDDHYGYGRVNARKAVELPPPTHELIAYSWATPPYVKPGTSAFVNVTLLNFGNDESDVKIQLLANETVVDSTMIASLPGQNSVEFTLTWLPAMEGLYNVTFYVVPVPGEANLENNALSKSLFVGIPIKAVVLHSAGNVYSNIITNWQTLNDEWYLFGDKMVYIDYTTLNKEEITYADIAATEADVLIISCAYDPYAGWQFRDSEIDAITRYVREGHGLIATAGTFYRDVPNNNKLAPLFGLDDTTVWYSTQTDLLQQLNTTHPLFRNVPNPFIFTYVGTSIPSDGRWDSNELVDGTYLATGHNQESAIVVNRGLVYMSPWLEAMPPYYYFHLQVLYNAITWSTYAKPEHDITVSIECPNRIDPGQQTLINASVLNAGLNNETGVELRLLVNDTVVDSTTIPELATGSSYTLSYLWTPAVEGRYNVTAYAPPVPNEDFARNNVASTSVRVGYFIANVAVLNALEMPPYFTGGWSNNYQLLVDALNGQGFYAQPITNEEIVSGKLGSFDVFVMVDNVPSEAAVPYVVAFWSKGGGLVAFDSSICFLNYAGVLPPESTGSNGFYTYWDYNTDSQARVSVEHPITEGYEVGEIIHGTGGDAEYRVDALASSSAYPYYTVLVEGETMTNRAYVSAYDSPSAGKVVHFWDQNHWGNPDLQLMIINAIDWVRLLHYEHDLAVSSVVRLRLSPGQTTAINATVRNMGLSNETDVELQLLINGSIVDETTIPELTTGQAFTLSYSWTPMLTAVYNVTAYAQPVPGEGNTANNVASKNVDVRPITYILFDQTHGTDYVGSYSTWVRSLVEKGYVVETNNISPITPDTLARCDVFIIPQASVPYTADELTAIQDFVFGGGGLLVVGDDYPYIYSDLTGFASITWTSGGASGITIDITSHPVTAGVSSVYLDAPVAMMYVTDGAQDLVRDPAGGIMLAVSDLSSGKVLGFADEDSLRDYSIGQADNLRLADNMLDWLSIAILRARDVAVTGLSVSPTDIYQGWIVNASVTAANLGDAPCYFNVSLYYDDNLAATEYVYLQPNETLNLNFLWVTIFVTASHNYTIKAEASIVPGETNPANNVWVDGTVNVRIIGDANGDGKVDIYDCILASAAFGASSSEPEYRVFCDVNQDGVVDIFDMIQFGIHYGEGS